MNRGDTRLGPTGTQKAIARKAMLRRALAGSWIGFAEVLPLMMIGFGIVLTIAWVAGLFKALAWVI